MENLFNVEESRRQNVVTIKVVGVGGGGNNMVDRMVREGLKGVEMIAANTDLQHLATSLAACKLQLGEKLTKGLGAGMKPEVGKEAAEESYEHIKETLKGANIVFVATGLGGGTGTGASSVVARAAREMGALTIAVCTMPFANEGKKRMSLARQGLEDLKKECDSIVLIQNQKLLSVIDKNVGYNESFVIVDSVLARAVRGMSSIVLPNDMPGIKTDFADLSTVMGHKGTALLGMGSAKGGDAAYNAIKEAIESPLLENLSINGACGVLVNFQFNPNYPFAAIDRALAFINEAADENAEVIFGTTQDENMDAEEVAVTIIATGFDMLAANNPPHAAEKTAQKPPIIRPMFDRKTGTDGYNGTDLDIPPYIRNQLD
ncbi:MAG: cell division protein FtsZ [Helicobacteraceae bacterium]|jgi:cell division protein FtsZ|nr:cell division protein FtsZ [Helicobacteraceae bacterium]